MSRYNTVPLILLILSIIDFSLAAPVLIPEQCHVCVDVVHVVPKDVITVLGKRGDRLEEMVKLFEKFDNWFWGESGSSSAVRPPSSSAPLESGYGSMPEHVPPGSAAPSTESNWDLESLVWHPPTSSTVPSTESESEHDPPPSFESESDHDPPPSLESESDHDLPSSLESVSDLDSEPKEPPPSPESYGYSHTLPSSPEWLTEPEHWYTPPSSPDPDWSTISNAPRAESPFENFQTASDGLNGKVGVSRRISTGTARGAANAAQSESHVSVSSLPPLPTFLSNKHFEFMTFFSLTAANVGESTNAPATTATGGLFRCGPGMSLPGLSDSPESLKQSASRGSANLMDEDF
jgi:hypothetical protein